MRIKIICQTTVEVARMTLPDDPQLPFDLLAVASSACYDAMTLSREGSSPCGLHRVGICRLSQSCATRPDPPPFFAVRALAEEVSVVDFVVVAADILVAADVRVWSSFRCFLFFAKAASTSTSSGALTRNLFSDSI